MYSVSRAFLFAIASSHSIEVTATAYLNDVVVAGAEDLLVSEGSVRVDGKSVVRRSVEGLKVTSSDGRTDTLRTLLEPPGTEVQVWRGIRYPAGNVEKVSIGRFVLSQVDDDLAQAGAVTVTGQDRMSRVVADRFLTPRAGTVGQRVAAQIANLIQETIPGATVTDNSGRNDTVPAGVVWERERGDAVNELATSIGCEVFADPNGDFVISPISSLSSPPVWTVHSGSNAVLLGGTRSTTRDGVFNAVVVTSSPTDGSAPSFGYAEDTDPTSPTYVSGPLGRVPRFYSSPLIATDAQATAAAQTILAKSIGRRGSLALVVMVNPALEVGDRIDVVLPEGGLQRHIADGFTVPLTPDGTMPVATRSTEDTVA